LSTFLTKSPAIPQQLYKTSSPSLSAIAELLIPYGSQRSKGVPSGTKDFLRLLVGELETPKLSQIFAYGKWLYPYITLQGRQIGTQDVWKRAVLRRNALSHQISSHLQPKSPQNLISEDLSIETYYTESQSHINGATLLKLYGYILLLFIIKNVKIRVTLSW